MNRQENREKISVRTACKALNITDRTLQRYVKLGRLTKIKEGHRTYFLSDEILQLKKDREQTDRRKNESIDKIDTVIIPSDKYNELLFELGALKERCNYLLEYAVKKERIEKELNNTKANLEETNKFFKDIVQENRELVNKYNLSTQEKDDEIEELKKNLKTFQKELDRVKSRSLIDRIFNK